MENLSDSALIEQYVKNHSNDAFYQIYIKYVDYVFKFVYSRTGNVQLTEDIVSDTFLILIDVLPNFKGESKLQTFIIGIAFNKLRTHWNSLKKESLTGLDEFEEFIIDDVTEDDENEIDDEKLKKEVQALLNTLDSKYKEVLIARFLENLSVKNTAKKLNLTEANVRVIQNRALEKLRSVTQ